MGRIGTVAQLYVAHLRRAGFLANRLLAVVGVASGVALVFASQVVKTSLDRSAQTLDQQLVGSPRYELDARGPAGVSERLLYETERLPGVAAALPEVEQMVNLIAADGRQRSAELIGIDPHFAVGGGRRLLALRQIPKQETIALPASLAGSLHVRVPAVVGVEVGERVVQTRLEAILGESEIGPLAHGPVALAPLEDAQLITGLETNVSRVIVQVRPGRAQQALAGLRRIAAAMHVNLEPAGFDAKLFAAAAQPGHRGQALLAWIFLLVGALLSSITALALAPSRGTPSFPSQGARIATTVLALDAFVLVVLSSVLGLALGEFLSAVTFQSSPAYLSAAFLVQSSRVVTWECVAIAIAVGVVAGCIGLAESLLLNLRSRVARPPWLAVVAASVVAVSCVVTVQGASHNLAKGLGAQLHAAGDGADIWIAPGGESNALSTTSFASPPREILDLPGVSALVAYHSGFLVWGERRVWVQAPGFSYRSLLAAGGLAGGEEKRAQARLGAGGWAVLSRSVAAEHNLREGDSFTLPSPTPTTFRVAALISDVGWPAGIVVIDARDYGHAWGGSEQQSALEIKAEQQTSPATLRRAVIAALEPHSGLVVETSSERERHERTLASMGPVRNGGMYAISLVVMVLAIGSVLGAFLLRSRRRIESLPRAEPGQAALPRAVASEAAAPVIVGCLAGALLGLCGQLLVSRGLANIDGLPISIGVYVPVALTTVAIALVFALTVVAIAGRRSADGQ